MVPNNQSSQGGSLPIWIPRKPATSPSPHLQGVTESSLVPGHAPPFHWEPSKIPDIPAISGAMFIWQRKGGCARKKAPVTNSLRVNMCWGDLCGKKDWGLSVLVLTHRSHLSRDTQRFSVQATTATVWSRSISRDLYSALWTASSAGEAGKRNEKSTLKETSVEN